MKTNLEIELLENRSVWKVKKIKQDEIGVTFRIENNINGYVTIVLPPDHPDLPKFESWAENQEELNVDIRPRTAED